MLPDPPVQIRLTVLPEVDCPYLPGRKETLRAVWASSVDPETYRTLMDVGFRRSGKMLYQPVCTDCQECVPLRVDVRRFVPSRSQKRVWRKNQDLSVRDGPPVLTGEKFELYCRYLHNWHGRSEDANWESLQGFLYDSPTLTLEFEYRDPNRQLLAVGICDLSTISLSSVYFYFDPDQSKRSLGTFGALYELAWAKARGLRYYYLGYWVRDCSAMSYKASFRPHETMTATGVWS
ncbi:MAG: putative arginyl-tRNA--protein transferase [Phycisphaerae bacterium]|jgi:arginine-tRNA-protein transferase|nr:MAG: putative arginyl-tRNA--protein transferase [Phycisphaerae bacterium]